MSDVKDPQFALQRVYIKDVSFEVPGAPKVFLQQWQPEVNIDLNTSVDRLEDGVHYDVTLALTVTARNQGEVAFLVEIKQAGIFQIEHVPEQEMAPLLGSYCPNLLFPFAREAISDLVGKGSFPQLLLQPINFDAVYAETLRKQQAAGASA